MITSVIQDSRFLSHSQDKLPGLLLNIFEGLNEHGMWIWVVIFLKLSVVCLLAFLAIGKFCIEIAMQLFGFDVLGICKRQNLYAFGKFKWNLCFLKFMKFPGRLFFTRHCFAGECKIPVTDQTIIYLKLCPSFHGIEPPKVYINVYFIMAWLSFLFIYQDFLDLRC